MTYEEVTDYARANGIKMGANPIVGSSAYRIQFFHKYAGIANSPAEAMDMYERFIATCELDSYKVLSAQEQRAARQAKLSKQYNLSERQMNFVARFWRQIEEGAAELGIPTTTVEDLYPHIDSIFKLTRGEYTLAQFNRVTGLNIKVSTFSKFSDHNL